MFFLVFNFFRFVKKITKIIFLICLLYYFYRCKITADSFVYNPSVDYFLSVAKIAAENIKNEIKGIIEFGLIAPDPAIKPLKDDVLICLNNICG
jgi:hypothetical protein